MTDFVGLGRMMLSYPDLAADVLAGRPLARKFVCRTFSDCTTGPRLGLVSGLLPARSALRAASARARSSRKRRRRPGHERPTSAHGQIVAVLTAFLSLFAVVGFALYGLPRFYPYFVQELGWSRQQVTSGNAYSKIFVALAFGFLAGRLVDRFGPRRLLLGGIVMAGGALVGLSYVTSMSAFYFFYTFNALGYVFGGPLPNQVLLSRWFDRARGKAMGIAYLGIGVGGALVPLLAFALTQAYGWRGALRILGVLMIAVALPIAYFVRDPAAGDGAAASAVPLQSLKTILSRPAFYFLMLGSMASIGAVGGTIQNLALYLSLDRKLPQVEIDTTLSIILAGSVIGRLTMGWLADRWAKKHVMFLIYLIVAVSIPMLVYAPTSSDAEDLRVLVRHRPRRRLHDHPADGRRAIRRGDSRPRDGDRADRRQRLRVAGADVRRVDARRVGQLRVGVPGAGRARGHRRRCGLAVAARSG